MNKMKELNLGSMGTSLVGQDQVATTETSPWCAACALCGTCGTTIAAWAGVSAFASF